MMEPCSMLETCREVPSTMGVYDNFDSDGLADSRFVAVGEGSTELIPRLWAERILGELRDRNPGTWRTLVGRASTGQTAQAAGG